MIKKIATDYKCKICNNVKDNELVTFTERHFGFGDKFEYVVCSNCKCIQIKTVPENIDKYYPKDYYSFAEPQFPTKLNPLTSFLKKSLINHYLGNFDLPGYFLSLFFEHPFPWFRKKEVTFNSRILDVGTGTGRKLLSLRRSGFKQLTGIDPYISKDINYNNLMVYKKNLSEIKGTYDCITLHHSFEHMPDPESVLGALEKLLDPNGVIIIRIPVADCYAWYKYGEFWVQLDAPRHFFIHTQKSIEILLQKTNMYLDEIVYDSNAHQFIMSEKYLRGQTLFMQDNHFTKKEIHLFESQAIELNEEKKGDSACFYIRKKK